MATKKEIRDAFVAILVPKGWTEDRLGNLVNPTKTQRIKFKKLVFRYEKLWVYDAYCGIPGKVYKEWMLRRSGYYAHCGIAENGKIRIGAIC